MSAIADALGCGCGERYARHEAAVERERTAGDATGARLTDRTAEREGRSRHSSDGHVCVASKAPWFEIHDDLLQTPSATSNRAGAGGVLRIRVLSSYALTVRLADCPSYLFRRFLRETPVNPHSAKVVAFGHCICGA